MHQNNRPGFALVRGIPATFRQCINDFHSGAEIEVELAKKQHQSYCGILEKLGLTLIRIEADDNLPDCCFIEDTAIVIADTGIITYPGTPTRVAETVEIEKKLSAVKNIYHITPPATIEGGDVLKIDKKIYIGNSTRTNGEGIKQVTSIIKPQGYEVIAVKIINTLHLKSVCTYLGNNCLLVAAGFFDIKIFSDYDIIVVPKEEEYCANCLVINGTVLIPKGYKVTKSLIEEKGFTVIELDMTEIEKADGALTCLSIIF